MFGLDNTSGVSVMPPIADKLNANPLWFTEGGGGVAASYPGKDWFNAIQAEIVNFIVASGLTPNKTDLTQITQAVLKNIQKSASSFANDTGIANAYVCNFTPAITTRNEGIPLRFKVANTNTGASTFNDGAGVYPLVGLALSALQGGEMVAGGTAWIQWHPYVGTGSYVLLFCTGGALQIPAGTKAGHAATLNKITSVIGSARNLAVSVTAASATATLTADEIIVETVLGGLKYQITSFAASVNLATVGAGGMDTGTAPVSGNVALYAILNPTTGATALLAVNATSAITPEVYSGASMPAGYTASALVSVLPTNSTGQIVVLSQNGRSVKFAPLNALITTVLPSSLTALSISSLIPLNAKSVSGYVTNTSTSGTGGLLLRLGTASFESFYSGGYVGMTGTGIYDSFDELPVFGRTIYYKGNANGPSAISAQIFISGYEF